MWQLIPNRTAKGLRLDNTEDAGGYVDSVYTHMPSGTRYLRRVWSSSTLNTLRMLASNTGEVVLVTLWYKDVENEAPERVQGRPLWCFRRDRKISDRFPDLVERVLFDLYFINNPAWFFHWAMGLPATPDIWGGPQGRSVARLVVAQDSQHELAQFEELLVGYRNALGRFHVPRGPGRQLQDRLRDALSKSIVGLGRLQRGDAPGANGEWRKAWHSFHDANLILRERRCERPGFETVGCLIDERTYADFARSECWPPRLS